MRDGVGGLEDIVRNQLVANRLVDHHRGVAVEHDGGATPQQVRMHGLGLEGCDLLRSKACEIQHLRHAEVKIAARLLTQIRLGERCDRGVLASQRQTCGDADVHM